MSPPVVSAPRLPARYYRALPAIVDALGAAGEQLLGKAGMAAMALEEDAWLSRSEVEALCHSAVELTGRGDLGWQIGRRIAPQDHAIVGRALLRSGTLDSALRMAMRYFSLLHPGFRLRYELGKTRGQLSILPWLPFSETTLRIHLEAILVALISELRYLHGAPLPRLDVQLSYERPPHAARYRTLLGGAVQFGCHAHPGLKVELPAATLCERRLSCSDPQAQAALALCEQSLKRQQPPGRLADWVAMMLREAQHELPDLGSLAALLAISPRTFARRLAAEGRGFRELLESVRMQRASTLIAQGDQSIDRIAAKLGYRDPANFRRAFRRVHGHPPRQPPQLMAQSSMIHP